MNNWLPIAPSLAGVPDLLAWVAAALVFGTATALLTWLLLSSVLRRARPALHGAFWLLVLLKFLLPVGPGWSLSLASLSAAMTPDWPLAGVNLPAAESPTGSAIDATTHHEMSTAVVFPLGPARVTHTATPITSASTYAGWATLAGGIYLLAVALLAIRRGFGYARFVAECRELPRAPRELQHAVARIARRVGIRRAPLVRLSYASPTPFLYGFVQPTLVLSTRHHAAPDELEAIILHELAHLRRADILVRLLQTITGTVLFFWPVVAWVNRRIDLAREQVCDEWALRHSTLTPARYARCLLRAVRPAPHPFAGFRPAAMAANKSHVERRIQVIMDSKFRAVARGGSSIVAASLLCGWGAFTLTGAVAPADEIADDQQQTVTVDVDATSDADGSAIVMIRAIGADGPVETLNETQMLWVDAASGASGIPHSTFVHAQRELSPESLASFLESNPDADADADGILTQDEHDAFVVALAMTDPAVVLTEFPDADVNADGLLDASEAAQLVTGQPLNVQKLLDGAGVFGPQKTGDGNVFIMGQGAHMLKTIELKDADGQDIDTGVRVFKIRTDSTGALPNGDPATNTEVRVMKIRRGDGDVEIEATLNGQPIDVNGDGEMVIETEIEDDGAGPTIITKRLELSTEDGATWTDDSGNTMPVPADAMFIGKNSPSLWIVNNVPGDVTRDAVAEQLGAVRSAPLAAFQRLHPEADRDGDGVVSAAERDEYVDIRQSEMRARFLEHHPEADLDGDGILTNDEFHTHMRENILNQHLNLLHDADGAPGEMKIEVRLDEGEEL